MFLDLFVILLLVFNAAFMPGVISFCMFRAKRYRMWEHTVTYLGRHKMTRKFYIPAVSLSSMTTMVALLLLLVVFGLWSHPWLKELAIIAGASLLVVACTNARTPFLSGSHRRFIHNLAAGVFFLSFILFVVLFSQASLRVNGFFGRAGLSWGILMLAATCYSFWQYKISSIPEWTFMFFAGAWQLFVAITVFLS